MTKTLIKPVENEDFCEAQNPKCELRPALLSDPDGAGINPPPFIWMAGRAEKSPKFCRRWERGGVISNSSDRRGNANVVDFRLFLYVSASNIL